MKELEMNSRKWMVASAGLVLCGLGAAVIALANDEIVTIDQTPAAVKAAIEEEVEGGKINKIEKDQYNGKTVYEVEFVDDGEVEEAAFTEDGKSVDEDDDDRNDEENDGEDKDSEDKG